MATKPKRPRDANQLAKMIVDLSTGEAQELAPREPSSERAAIGRKGGLKGGLARASRLSDEQRRDIARLAANARWKKT